MIAEKTVVFGRNFDASTLTEPKKDDYVFVGWKKKTDDKVFDFSAVKITEDVTFMQIFKIDVLKKVQEARKELADKNIINDIYKTDLENLLVSAEEYEKDPKATEEGRKEIIAKIDEDK